jgi:hypothetical protein
MEMTDYDYDCLETGEFDEIVGCIQNEDGVFYI